MIAVRSTPLEGHGVRLEPLGYEHEADLAAALADGKLWELWFTAVPEPAAMHACIANALTALRERTHAARSLGG